MKCAISNVPGTDGVTLFEGEAVIVSVRGAGQVMFGTPAEIATLVCAILISARRVVGPDLLAEVVRTAERLDTAPL